MNERPLHVVIRKLHVKRAVTRHVLSEPPIASPFSALDNNLKWPRKGYSSITTTLLNESDILQQLKHITFE